jgi:hypothetical protein
LLPTSRLDRALWATGPRGMTSLVDCPLRVTPRGRLAEWIKEWDAGGRRLCSTRYR